MSEKIFQNDIFPFNFPNEKAPRRDRNVILAVSLPELIDTCEPENGAGQVGLESAHSEASSLALGCCSGDVSGAGGGMQMPSPVSFHCVIE